MRWTVLYRSLFTVILFVGFLDVVACQASAQLAVDSAEVAQRMTWFQTHRKMRDESPLKDLDWLFVGPMAMTGRVTDVDAHPSQPETIYIASCSGGVFKSVDDGKNWNPIFEDHATASIGDLAIDPNDPNTIWVGTGEANIFRSTMAGIGIYKSTDAGKTFEYKGLGDTHHIARILVHPKNSDVIYVASPGHEYTHNEQRGVYKSVNGGDSWEKVFYQDEKTGAIDLVMDPSNPDVLYVGTAERLRYRWNDPKPGPQSGIWKTTDAGKTWKTMHNGLPELAQCERVGLDVCASKPNVVYALINNLNQKVAATTNEDASKEKEGEQNAKEEGKEEGQDAKEEGRSARGRSGGPVGADLYRSDDFGETWVRCEGSDKIGRIYASYGWVFGQVRVDPNDPDVVFVHGVSLMKSTDGGKTFANVRGNHSDYHAMWIDPTDSKHILVGNDGGFMMSRDGLETFFHPTNIPIATLYNVAIGQDMGSFFAYSTIQDNMGWRGAIEIASDRSKITYQEWQSGYGDESGRHAVDPTDSDNVYAVNRYGTGPYHFDFKEEDRAKRRKAISPKFEDAKRRAQWVSPLTMSSHDPSRIFYGAQFVFLTNDKGDNWKRISPDLTNFDPEKQGNIEYSTIFSIAESPVKKGLIYAGTDDGNVQITQDEGLTWTNVSSGLPKDCFIASIEACRAHEGTVFIAVNGKRINNFNCYLFKSTDFGKTWESISNGIPGGIANVIKQDPTDSDILYAGTDLGVYFSLDGGKAWHVLGTGLPTVYVHDLAIHHLEHVAVIATHGRGAWAIDLLPVRALKVKAE